MTISPRSSSTYILVNHAIVFDGQVVSKRNLDAMENFHILPQALQHMRGHHRTHPIAQPVVQPRGVSDRTSSKPDERFPGRIFLDVDVAIVFRLQRDIARVKTVAQNLSGKLRAGIRAVWRSASSGLGKRPAQIKLVQRVTHNHAAMVRVAIREFAVERIYPFREGSSPGGGARSRYS